MNRQQANRVSELIQDLDRVEDKIEQRQQVGNGSENDRFDLRIDDAMMMRVYSDYAVPRSTVTEILDLLHRSLQQQRAAIIQELQILGVDTREAA